MRSAFERARALSATGQFVTIALIARSHLGELSRDEMINQLHSFLDAGPSPRLYTTTCQVAVELTAARGFLDDALDFLERACGACLIDIDWLDHCPLLAPLREHPRLLAVRRQVTERVETMWIV